MISGCHFSVKITSGLLKRLATRLFVSIEKMAFLIVGLLRNACIFFGKRLPALGLIGD